MYLKNNIYVKITCTSIFAQFCLNAKIYFLLLYALINGIVKTIICVLLYTVEITQTNSWQHQYSRTWQQLWKWYTHKYNIIFDRILSYLQRRPDNKFVYQKYLLIEINTCLSHMTRKINFNFWCIVIITFACENTAVCR